MESITKIFTTEDTQELKQGFKEIILKQFESQIEQMDVYLFNPDDVENMIQEAFEEVVEGIKLEFKEKLRDKMINLLENTDIEKLLSLKKKVK